MVVTDPDDTVEALSVSAQTQKNANPTNGVWRAWITDSTDFMAYISVSSASTARIS